MEDVSAEEISDFFNNYELIELMPHNLISAVMKGVDLKHYKGTISTSTVECLNKRPKSKVYRILNFKYLQNCQFPVVYANGKMIFYDPVTREKTGVYK